ncbi:MAG: hypothetical protein CM15mV117_160 [Caudoviricetes sp.]|nr:MAG: hypothetical protein CM15mV117_160 [Caudoviricetes sp.]
MGKKKDQIFTHVVEWSHPTVNGRIKNIVVNECFGSNVKGDEEEGRQLGIALSAAIESELIKQKRPGGLLA